MTYEDLGYWPGWDLTRASDVIEEVEDLDPNRTVTYLENGVPHCYMGHAECYDSHDAERRTDEADWEADRCS